MQATVRGFDPASREGTVLLDNGTEIPFPGAAFDAGGLRLVRVGQRVRIQMRDGAISHLTLATFPGPAEPG